MRNLLKYLLLYIVCFGGFLSLSAGENAPHEDKYNIQDEIIYSFHASMGFDYLTKEESDMIPTDSILDYLEASKQYKTYFELERVIIKSFLFRGEIRFAIAQSEQMYSKASIWSDHLGMALALNAMGEVYSYTGRIKEAGDTYAQALELFDQLHNEDIHIHILLV